MLFNISNTQSVTLNFIFYILFFIFQQNFNPAHAQSFEQEMNQKENKLEDAKKELAQLSEYYFRNTTFYLCGDELITIYRKQEILPNNLIALNNFINNEQTHFDKLTHTSTFKGVNLIQYIQYKESNQIRVQSLPSFIVRTMGYDNILSEYGEDYATDSQKAKMKKVFEDYQKYHTDLIDKKILLTSEGSLEMFDLRTAKIRVYYDARRALSPVKLANFLENKQFLFRFKYSDSSTFKATYPEMKGEYINFVDWFAGTRDFSTTHYQLDTKKNLLFAKNPPDRITKTPCSLIKGNNENASTNQSNSSTASGQVSQLSQLDGDWYSNEWKYGYTLTNGVGIATSTNSANFKVGDKIIFLKQTSDKTFEGTQVYTDGKFYKITVQQQSHDTLFFKGEKNVSWTMVKKAQTSTPSETSKPSTKASPAVPLSPLNLAPTGQRKLPPCQGTATESWTVCFGSFTFAGGANYVGEYKDGKRNGQGTYTFASGEKYVGEFKDGKYHGQGTHTFVNGDKYVGEFKDDERHGEGTYTIANGGKYFGEHKDGKRNGQGTFTFDDGGKYVGEFKDGKPHGQGTDTFANGDKYLGEFKDGKQHGNGAYTFADGDRYVGEYKDGKRNGQGTFTFASGEKYVGEFKDGKYHGQGILTWKNGSKYVGEWSNDSGIKGVMTFADGRTATGTVQNAVFNAKAVPSKTSELGVIQEFINLRPQYKQVSFYEDSLKIKPIQISNSENNGKQLTYDVKGCEFSVDTDENKNVISYELNVSESCPRFTIEVEGLVFDSKNTTLKKILNQVKSCYSYFFRVEYVIYLGNMYDPRDLNYLELSGVRACNSREIIFTFPENKGIAQWKEKIKNDYGGSDNLPDNQRKEINSDRRYNKLAENLWADPKPSKILIK